MADNVNKANGFVPVGHLSGAPWSGKTNMYFIPSTDATAVGIGDVVTLGGTSGAAGTVVYGIPVEGMPTVARAAAGSTPVGIIVGFLPNQSDLSVKHRAVSTARIALVADEPDLVMSVQEDSLVSSLAAADVGENCDMVTGTVDTTTGNGLQMLDSSTHVATAATFRVLRLDPKPGNVMNSTGGITDERYARWLVTFTEHQFKSTAGI